MLDASKQTIKLFYCYAREDRDLRDQFEKSLAGLKRYYRLSNWYDREILAGQDWEEAIAEQLNSADIIFLLISNDFMASDYCYGIEMQRALERHREGNCLVIPILLRPTHWEGEPFSTLQLLPTDAKPITRWQNLDDAFLDVVKEVSRAIKALPIHKSKEEWLEEGQSYYKVNNFSEAIAAYNKAIKRDAHYALAYQYRGEANYRLKNFTEALADFEQAASLDPTLISAYTWKGDTLKNLNQNRQAIFAYAKGLTVADKAPQDQQDTKYFNSRGDAFYGLKFFEEALTDYDQAIRLDPNDAVSYYNKGLTLRNLKRYEDALSTYEQAIRLDPNNADYHIFKGLTLYELKRYEDALIATDQAIRLDPNNAVSYYNKGLTLYQLKRYEDALSAYEQAIRLDLNNADYHYNKGLTLYELKRYEDAERAFEQAIRLNPNNAVYYNNKGNTLRKLKRYEDAERAFSKAHEL